MARERENACASCFGQTAGAIAANRICSSSAMHYVHNVACKMSKHCADSKQMANLVTNNQLELLMSTRMQIIELQLKDVWEVSTWRGLLAHWLIVCAFEALRSSTFAKIHISMRWKKKTQNISSFHIDPRVNEFISSTTFIDIFIVYSIW